MKYKVEVVRNKKVLYENILVASHPNQIIRIAVNSTNSKNSFIFITSQNGKTRIYHADDNLNIKLVDNFDIYGLDLDYIFTGNKTIFEVLQ